MARVAQVDLALLANRIRIEQVSGLRWNDLPTTVSHMPADAIPAGVVFGADADGRSFVTALLECDALSEESGVPVRFDVSEEWREVPLALPLCLYRVAQEVLRNVATQGTHATSRFPWSSSMDIARCPSPTMAAASRDHGRLESIGVGFRHLSEPVPCSATISW